MRSRQCCWDECRPGSGSSNSSAGGAEDGQLVIVLGLEGGLAQRAARQRRSVVLTAVLLPLLLQRQTAGREWRTMGRLCRRRLGSREAAHTPHVSPLDTATEVSVALTLGIVAALRWNGRVTSVCLVRLLVVLLQSRARSSRLEVGLRVCWLLSVGLSSCCGPELC